MVCKWVREVSSTSQASKQCLLYVAETSVAERSIPVSRLVTWPFEGGVSYIPG